MVETVHGVNDRRCDIIRSFDVEPLEYARLGPEHVGATVVYRDKGRAEAGTITSWDRGIVWARYNRGDTAAAARASDLWLTVG
jgi:hypothetical protein